MKKLSLTLLILASIIHVLNGQIEKPIKKGTILLGGSFSINFEKEETKYLATVSRPARTSKTDIKTFETDAYFGYFLSDQVTFGLKTDIIFEQYKYPRTSYIEKEVNNFFLRRTFSSILYQIWPFCRRFSIYSYFKNRLDGISR